MSALKNT